MDIFLIFIMAVCHSLQTLFARLFNRDCKSDPKAASTVFTVLFGASISVLTFAIGGFSFSASKTTILLGVCNAATLIAFNVSLFRATERGSYAISMISMLFGGILIPMVVSILAFQQTLTPLQIAATVIMLVAFVLLNLNGTMGQKPRKGFWPACILLGLSNGAFGALLTVQANVMQGAERVEMILISYLSSALFSLILLFIKRKKDAPRDFCVGKRSALWGIVCFAAATVAVNLLLFVLARVNTTVTTAMDNGLILVFSTLFALFLFGEKPSKPQYAGLVCALAGILAFSF